MALHFLVQCSMCKEPLKLKREGYRFTCMCDEEIRMLCEHQLYSHEHGWRVHFPERDFTLPKTAN